MDPASKVSVPLLVVIRTWVSAEANVMTPALRHARRMRTRTEWRR